MLPLLKSKLKNEDGQAAIIFAFCIILFTNLIAIVVNISMLVHYKINLQNAVDMAAYAGAATQARALTQIAHINYHMRQNYKEFLFKYYVLGNLGFKGFPNSRKISANTDVPDSPYDFKPTNSPSGFVPIPQVCIFVKSTDNFCDFKTLPKLADPNLTRDDPIVNALYAVKSQIDAARSDDQKRLSLRNQLFLAYWLYNVQIPINDNNPDDDVYKQHWNIPGRFRIGLVPANVLDKLYIDAITEAYFGQEPNFFKKEDASDSDPPNRNEFASEGFLLAWKSLKKNLNENILENELTIQEILPSKGLHLITESVDIDPIYIEAVPGGGSSNTPMVSKLMPVRELPVAVYKDEAHPIYYGVKVDAEVRILFNPFGSLPKLSAVAFAKPFGGVIGPEVEDRDFFFTFNVNGKNANIPNIAVSQSDRPSAGDDLRTKGFMNQRVLGNYCSSFDCTFLTQDSVRLTGEELPFSVLPQDAKEKAHTEARMKIINQAIEYARSADPDELGKYLIPSQWTVNEDTAGASSIRNHSGLFFRNDPEMDRDTSNVNYNNEAPISKDTSPTNPSGSIYTIPIPIDEERIKEAIQNSVADALGSVDSNFKVRLIDDFINTLKTRSHLTTFAMKFPGSIYPVIPPDGSYQTNSVDIADTIIRPKYHNDYKLTTVSIDNRDNIPSRSPGYLMTGWYNTNIVQEMGGNQETKLFARRAEYSVKLVHINALLNSNDGNDRNIHPDRGPEANAWFSVSPPNAGSSNVAQDLGQLNH